MDTQGEWATKRGTVLTITDAVHLSTVIRWAQKNARLNWINDDSTKVQSGTARSVGDERGNFLSADDDVRDGFFRITTSMGWELFLPMVDVVAMVRNGTMVED